MTIKSSQQVHLSSYNSQRTAISGLFSARAEGRNNLATPVKFNMKTLVYIDVKAAATPGIIPMSMENPALEIEDFERFVEQYRARLLRFLFASVRDMDLAETLTQDCFWKAYKHRSAFRGECSVNTWLIRIAVNLVRDHARSRRFQFWRKVERVDHGGDS